MNKTLKFCLISSLLMSLYSSPSFAGRGINAVFNNATTNNLAVSFEGETCWYPNDLGHDFTLSPFTFGVNKYTEIKSSGVCPAQPSRLFFMVRGVKIQIKGTNGDIGGDYSHICTDSSAGFEVASKGALPKNISITCESISDRGLINISVIP